MLVIRVPVLVEGLEDRHFHHALVEIGWLVLDYFYSHDLVIRHVLALDDLPERALAQHI